MSDETERAWWSNALREVKNGEEPYSEPIELRYA